MSTSDRTIAVIGLGAMGSRLAANLLAAGADLIVHNRTPAAAAPLVARGARAAPTPREAAEAASVVVTAVSDDEASRAVWRSKRSGVLAGLRPDAIAIEASTLSVAWVVELAAQVTATGARFLEAPMVGSRPQAEAGALHLLVGGEATALDEVRDVLDTVAAGIHHVGDVGSGATLKLVVNGLLATQTAALAELLGLVRLAGIPDDAAAALLGALPVTSAAAKRAMGLMLDEQWAPNFPIRLVEKDLRYLVEAGARRGLAMPVAEATHRQFAAAARSGSGEKDIVAVGKPYLAGREHRSPV